MSPLTLVLVLAWGSAPPEPPPPAPAAAAEPPASAVLPDGSSAAPAVAAEPEVLGSPVTELEPPPARPGAEEASPPQWGLLLDAGVPDLLGASLLFRPLPWLRLSGGMATNTAGVAARAGVGVVLYFPVAPSLNLDVGRYFPADYRPLLASLHLPVLSGAAGELLQRFGYDFASATLGVEVGSPRHFAFFARGGICYWSLEVPQAEAILRDQLKLEGVTARPLQVRFTTPSVKLGLLIYFP